MGVSRDFEVCIKTVYIKISAGAINQGPFHSSNVVKVCTKYSLTFNDIFALIVAKLFRTGESEPISKSLFFHFNNHNS